MRNSITNFLFLSTFLHSSLSLVFVPALPSAFFNESNGQQTFGCVLTPATNFKHALDFQTQLMYGTDEFGSQLKIFQMNSDGSCVLTHSANITYNTTFFPDNFLDISAIILDSEILYAIVTQANLDDNTYFRVTVDPETGALTDYVNITLRHGYDWWPACESFNPFNHTCTKLTGSNKYQYLNFINVNMRTAEVWHSPHITNSPRTEIVFDRKNQRTLCMVTSKFNETGCYNYIGTYDVNTAKFSPLPKGCVTDARTSLEMGWDQLVSPVVSISRNLIIFTFVKGDWVPTFIFSFDLDTGALIELKQLPDTANRMGNLNALYLEQF